MAFANSDRGRTIAVPREGKRAAMAIDTLMACVGVYDGIADAESDYHKTVLPVLLDAPYRITPAAVLASTPA